uniref:Uncharacterized protein n=1 Tax=Nelumbo nucifera TaxID=4432 RepID=A0A822ZF49_NELNU|nr:TPA_asm: hypothetical protein HUJ06_014551 [Nelumbo nucifera]
MVFQFGNELEKSCSSGHLMSLDVAAALLGFFLERLKSVGVVADGDYVGTEFVGITGEVRGFVLLLAFGIGNLLPAMIFIGEKSIVQTVLIVFVESWFDGRCGFFIHDCLSSGSSFFNFKFISATKMGRNYSNNS